MTPIILSQETGEIIVGAAALGIWLACGLVAAGFLNANYRTVFPDQNEREQRETLAHCVGMGLLFGPLSLIMSLFVTGFWQDGWTLKGSKS